jgi:integrase/recombinase XerD
MLTMTPLRRRLIEDLQLRNRSPKTIEVYVYHVRELARYCKQSPAQLADEQVHRYLLYLLHDKRVSWSSYNQAVAALRFF